MQGHCPWFRAPGTQAAGSWRELWGSIASPFLPALPKASTISPSQTQGTGLAEQLACPRTTNLLFFFLLRSRHGGKAEDKLYSDS